MEVFDEKILKEYLICSYNERIKELEKDISKTKKRNKKNIRINFKNFLHY